MDQVSRFWRRLSLRKSIVLYIAGFAVLAILLSTVTSAVCYYATRRIYESYPPAGEKYYLTTESGERLGDGAYISGQRAPLSEQDQRLTSALDFLPVVAVPAYSALCILAAALLFYRNKLREPLSRLRSASEKIARNDLDFRLDCPSEDELGQLCQSFETMRRTLAENFSQMWRQVEERGRLNAAFAHELRTPLTVLKGYAELLETSGDAGTRETAVTMGRHIARMEHYIGSMSSLRRLEDTRPEYRAVPLEPLFASLWQSAAILCEQNGKALSAECRVPVPELSIDAEFVTQVCSNLISNAVRYAGSRVTLSLSLEDSGLLLAVADDGNGFAEDALPRAAEPYFTRESGHPQHFGLGLYICKLLCERHGGALEVGNTPEGARVSAFFASSVDKK